MKTVTYTGPFDRYRVDVTAQDGSRKRVRFPKGRPVEVADDVAAKVLARDDFVQAEAENKPSKPGRSGGSGSSEEK